MKKLIMLLLVTLGLVFILSAPEVNAAAKVSLSAKKASLSVGTSKKLKLKNAKNVTWKSSNKKIATVTKDGKVRAVSAGSCVITATAGGKSYSCKITVSAVDKKYVGSYKAISYGYGDAVMGEEYFDIYEKHGIILYSLIIKDNGKVTLKLEDGDDTKLDLTIADKYMLDEKGNKLIYFFKDGDVIIFIDGFLSNSMTDITFVKMNDEEIAMSKKKVTEKQLKSAEDEVNAYKLTDKDIMESKTMKELEQRNLSNDNMEYDTFVEAAMVAAASEDVRKELKAGHTFKIEITKEKVTIYKDGKEIDKDDAFYVSFAGYAREYWITTSKVHSVYADKYVIDIDSDGAVHKTLAPKKEEV